MTSKTEDDFKNGRLPDVLKEYLLPVTGLALRKPDSEKPRPVAVGELFYRIVTSWSVEALASTASGILAPIQVGLGVKGGVEKANLFAQTLLTDDELGFSGVATDIGNAYNNRERNAMLNELYSYPELSSISRFAN